MRSLRKRGGALNRPALLARLGWIEDGEADGGADAGLAGQPDAAAHLLDRLAGDREPEPGALRDLRVGADELVEDPRLFLLGNAEAVVLDLDPPVAAVLLAGADPHPARLSGLAVLDGITHQVDEHQLGPGGVD